MRSLAVLLLAIALTVPAGCSSEPADGPGDKPAPSDKPLAQKPKFEVTSTAFQQGQPIPKQYTGDGEDVSPPLRWSGAPADVKEFALICDDPDAPQDDPWVHWVIYRIPGDATGLPEDLAKVERPKEPVGAVQGRNSWDEGENMGYRGPAPPPGKPHRYFFRVYALDASISDQPGMTKRQLRTAMSGHVVAEGELMGTYERK